MGRARVVILVVGDVMDDVVVRPLLRLAPGTDTPSEITPRPGGSGANTAAWIGALGGSVRFAGRVGAGDVDRHAAELAAHGVDARLAGDPAWGTGALVSFAQDRTMYTDRGANAHLCADDLPAGLLDGVAHVHVSGYALFEPGPRAAALAFVRAAGVPWSVDPGSASFLRDAPDFLDWTAGAALCLPNEDEAAVLGEALEGAYPEVVVKRGRRGALHLRAGAPPAIVPATEAFVVDLTGAGDAFAAGWLVARLRGDDPGPLAAATAARALAVAGGRP
jgi:sugar/nucleoside kinase (ribokinase family)